MINEIHTLNGKTVGEVLHEFKNEFREFSNTRVKLFQEEMRRKMTIIKASIPAVVIGALFLLTAWFLFTACLVTLVAQAFQGNPWAYPIAFGCVFVLYALIGGATALAGWKGLSKESLKPEKTIKVLQDDKLWFQTEAKRVQA